MSIARARRARSKRPLGVHRAVAEEGEVAQRGDVVRVLLQARLEGLAGRAVGALAEVLLAREPQAVDRVPVEVGRRLERPRERSRVRGAAPLEAVADPHPQALLRDRDGHGLRPRLERHRLDLGLEDHLVPVEDLQLLADGLERREGQVDPALAHRHVEAAERRAGHEALRAHHGEPVLGPGVGAVGHEAPVLERRPRAPLGRLVEGAAGLQLDVLPVGVGEELLPDHPLAGEAPDPDLLAELLVARRPPAHAEAVVVPEGAPEVGLPAEDVVGLRAPEVVSLVEGEVAALRVDRPGAHLAPVPDLVGARVDELQVPGGLEAGVHPRVVGLLERRLVVPQRRGREVRLVGGERDLEPPGRAGEEVEDADHDRGAAVRVLAGDVVDRGRAVRRVADDAVVRLDAPARPRAAHGHVPELHHLVAVEERLPGGLLDRRPDLAADLRHHRDPDPAVLQLHDRPLLVDRLVGEPVEAEVGVDAARRWRSGPGRRRGRSGRSSCTRARWRAPRSRQGREEPQGERGEQDERDGEARALDHGSLPRGDRHDPGSYALGRRANPQGLRTAPRTTRTVLVRETGHERADADP